MCEIIRKTTKIASHDYSSDSVYFITICTEARQYLLGYKAENQILLSQMGEKVALSWEKIGTLYSGVSLDAYIIMPNHLHGIVLFDGAGNTNKESSLSDVIRDFKSFTTHLYYKDKFRLTGNLWQRGYHERILRNNELDIYRKYIADNPTNWENDKFYELEQSFQAESRGGAPYPPGDQKT